MAVSLSATAVTMSIMSVLPAVALTAAVSAALPVSITAPRASSRRFEKAFGSVAAPLGGLRVEAAPAPYFCAAAA
jgi:hypothetical protein